MNLVRTCRAAALLSFVFSLPIYAQDRDLRGERLFLDDDNGEGITILAPHPMPNGASYSLILPDSLPPTPFVLFGNPSGAITAQDPSTALNTVSWLLSGNSLSNPANDFLGTTDSVDLAFRTNGVERIRVDALGNIGIGAASLSSARLFLNHTFNDSVEADPMFSVPLAIGIRSQATNPAVADSGAIYISSAGLMLLQGSNDMSAAGSFMANVGTAVNGNTGGGVNELTGVLGIAMQVDPAASVSGSMAGVRAQAQATGGTVNEITGLSAGVAVQDVDVSRASGVVVNMQIGGSDTVDNGYGVYLQSPYVDNNATLTNYAALAIDNLNDSGQVAIRYDGSGQNSPFIVEGDGDVGIGTNAPGEARLRIAKTFADSVSVDPQFSIPITFGVRADITNPNLAFPGAIYIGNATLSSITGGSDMSSAGQFIGGATLVNNSNTGGTVNGMIGMVGQVFQTDPASSAGFISGALAQVQVSGGTAGQVNGLGSQLTVAGNASVSEIVGLSAGIAVNDNATVNNGYGLMIQQPFVNASAALTNYTGIQINNLPDSGQTALRYDGSGSNGPFVIHGNGDVNIGTTSPGEARVYVSRTFPDSVATDPLFGEQLSFGLRTDAINPSTVDSAAAYVAAAGIARVEGGNDMSDADAFVGSAGLSINANNGGTVSTLLGSAGEARQNNPSAAAQTMIGTLGNVRVSGGTVGMGAGLLAGVEMDGGTASAAFGMLSRLDLSGGASVTNGVGLLITAPSVNGGATLSNFVGLQIDDLSGSGYTPFQYNGSTGQVIIEGDGDMGIGDNSPDARLDVENNSASVPTLAVANGDQDGIGLHVAAGSTVLSYGSGAPATIPVGTTVFNVDDGLGGLPPVVGVPASGTDGQILYIYVSDPEGATIEGIGYSTGDRLTYIRVAGAWQLFHVN